MVLAMRLQCILPEQAIVRAGDKEKAGAEES
jgi:hypothetical protein